MICPRCGQLYSDREEKCPICLSPNPAKEEHTKPNTHFCPYCGKESGGMFCPYCGKKLPDLSNMSSASYTAPFVSHAVHPMTAAYQKSLAETPRHPKLNPWMKAFVVFCVILQLFEAAASYYTSQEMTKTLMEEWSIPTEEPANPSFDDYFTEDFLDPYTNTSAESFPAGCSEKEYNQLETGMTYAEISAIIGGDAQGEDLSKKTEEGAFAAVWPAEDSYYGTLTVVFEDGVATSIEASGL